jgi:hypothetical protein
LHGGDHGHDYRHKPQRLFLGDRQMEAVAMATLKKEMASPICFEAEDTASAARFQKLAG